MFSKKSQLAAMEEIGYRLAVVAIDKKDPTRRTLTVSGLNLFAAMEEIAKLSQNGVQFLLCIDLPPAMWIWQVEAYRPYVIEFPHWFGHYDHDKHARAGEACVRLVNKKAGV
jgi:hypothetical protein